MKGLLGRKLYRMHKSKLLAIRKKGIIGKATITSPTVRKYISGVFNQSLLGFATSQRHSL
jgi:hypothetical protein